MNKYLLVIFCMLGITVMAQRDNKAVQISHYVLDTFTKGRVQVKSGTVYEQQLNYNVLTGEMIFRDNGRFLAIANPVDVDTVFINERKFVPVDGKFYELLAGSNAPLFMEFTCKVDEPAVSVGYGNASPTTNVTSLSSLVRTGGVYDIKLPDDFKVIPVYNYWIRKNGRYEKANTAQQLMKLFPDKKSLIKEFAKKNNINFSTKADVILLVQQLH